MIQRELKNFYNSAKKISSVIGILMATVSALRLVSDIFNLEFIQVFANLIKTYQAIFHSMFDFIFAWVPFKIPRFVKDFLIFYSFFGLSYLHVIMIKFNIEKRHPWFIKHNFGDSKFRFYLSRGTKVIAGILFWPNILPELFAKPYMVIHFGAHGPSNPMFQDSRPAVDFRGHYYGDGRILMVLRLLCIAMGVGIVLVLNYLGS